MTLSKTREGQRAQSRQLLVLFGCTLGMTLNLGSLFNGSLTAFIKPIAAETGWSRGQISISSTMAIGACFLMMALIGRLADRFGPRRVIAVGAPLYAMAFASLGWMPPIYPLHLAACVLVGLTGAATYAPVYNMLLARFFDARLGLALGVMSAGAGVGIMLAPILSSMLIAEIGWRGAYGAMGVIVAAILLPVVFFFLRDSEPAKIAVAGLQPTQAGRNPAGFWQAGLAYFLMAMTVSGTLVHLVPLLTDRGVSIASAALYASYLGMGSIIARIVVGFLLDHLDAGLVGAAGFLLGGVGVALLALGVGPVATAVGILLVGCALGTEADVLPYVTRRLAGPGAFGRRVSSMTGAFLAGVLTGPLTAGLMFDAVGGYQGILYGFAVGCFIAAALHAGVTRPRRGPRAEHRPNAHALSVGRHESSLERAEGTVR